MGILLTLGLFLSLFTLAACGGGLYFVASFTTALMLVLLRFGPRVLPHSQSIVLPFQIDASKKSMNSKQRSSKASLSFNYD